MFQAAHCSSSGALNCICSLWFIYPCGDRSLSRLSLDNGQSPHRYTNQRLQIQFRAPDDEWCAFNKLWNNKFYNKLHLVGISTGSYYDTRFHEYQIHQSYYTSMLQTISWNMWLINLNLLYTYSCNRKISNLKTITSLKIPQIYFIQKRLLWQQKV